MDYPEQFDKQTEREDFIQSWHQQEKMFERIGAVLLLFAAALILVFEKPSPEEAEIRAYALAATVACLSAGLTLLLRSRRPREDRRALYFLQASSHSRNANYAITGALLLFWQGSGRPLMMIGAVILFVFGLWLKWRAYKIGQFDNFFAKPIEENNE